MKIIKSPLFKFIFLNEIFFSIFSNKFGVPSFLVFLISFSKLFLCDLESSIVPFLELQLSIATKTFINKLPYSYQPFFILFLAFLK